MPSRKWWAARVVALTGLATLVATAGAWTQQATIMAITLVSAAALAWLVPNSDDEAEGGGGQRGQAEPLTLLVYVIVFLILVAILFKVLDRL